MPGVVLDSSFLIAWMNARDVHHRAARALAERLLAGEFGSLWIPEYVFLEVVTVLAARRDQALANDVARRLLEARETTLVASSTMFLDVVSRFTSQTSRRLSFTDAAILVVAERQGCSHIATFDRDFRGLSDAAVVP